MEKKRNRGRGGWGGEGRRHGEINAYKRGREKEVKKRSRKEAACLLPHFAPQALSNLVFVVVKCPLPEAIFYGEDSWTPPIERVLVTCG